MSRNFPSTTDQERLVAIIAAFAIGGAIGGSFQGVSGAILVGGFAVVMAVIATEPR